MKFGVIGGVQPEDQRSTQATLARLARAESQGFEAAWIAANDAGGGAAGRSLFAAVTLAERTERVRIGLWGVLDPALHPLRLAEDLAVLDIVSGGRLDWAPTGSGLEEPLEVVALAWQGEAFAHEGERFQFPELVCLPVPEQKPHPMVWLPADGTRRPDPWDPDRCGRLIGPPIPDSGGLADGEGPRALVYPLEVAAAQRRAALADSLAELAALHDPETILIWPGAGRVSEAEALAVQDAFAEACLGGPR
ncbi:MAG: LLM class flavin-dependent oxidoreductase [Myxococcota bacterium]